jgi:hypothetical protein
MSGKDAADPSNTTGTGDQKHFENFVKVLRSRNRAELNADIEEGHLSTALCHLSNIAYREGRELQFDGHNEKFVNNSKADQYLTRKYRAPFEVPAFG